MTPPSLSVVVPCYNESGNLVPLVDRVRAVTADMGVPVEVVLVDDGSSDGTRAEIEGLEARDELVVGEFHATNRGIAGAWRSGVHRASADHVLLLDADLQYDPSFIPLLWKRLAQGDCDAVQGWRQYAKGFHSPLRYLMSVGFSGLLQAAFGVRLRDIKSDFILCDTVSMRAALEDARHFRFFQHYITVALTRRGVRIRQVAVTFGDRNEGESFIHSPFRFAFEAVVELPRAVRYYRSLARDAAGGS